MALRDNPLGEVKLPLVLSAAAALLVAIVVAVALLMSDRRETFRSEAYGVTRKAADAVAAPVSGAIATPIRWVGMGVDGVRGYFFAVSENRRLKAELKTASQWRVAAIALRDTNDRYKALLGLKTDPPIPMVAARAVTDSRGPFANTRLINAGKESGIAVGNPVMSENGLVGRVIGVTDGASRILLLTDVASRTPVMVDRNNARAILTGDGGPNPRLDYLRGKAPVADGDQILTSGDGGVLPRGLPVGRAVKGLDGRWRVILASDAAPVDFVRILLFQDFRQLVDAKQLDQLPLPPPATPTTSVGMVSTPAAAPPPMTPPVTASPTPAPAVKPTTAPVKPAPTKPADAAATQAKPAPPKPAPAKPAPSPDAGEAPR
ncbi:MAG TPA: rod shape-determining protein MreC [Phenylobacterium sp.]|nr:rod shape-determining protein MreC [Phenylobacterium sp.]